MLHYYASGRGAAPATALKYGALWNPSTDKVLYVVRTMINAAGTTSGRPRLMHITTRGTPGATVTPDADNSMDASGIAPPSGALIDLSSYTVDPTGQPPPKFYFNISASGGMAEHRFAQPIAVAAGTGLAWDIVGNLATTDVTFEWME